MGGVVGAAATSPLDSTQSHYHPNSHTIPTNVTLKSKDDVMHMLHLNRAPATTYTSPTHPSTPLQPKVLLEGYDSLKVCARHTSLRARPYRKSFGTRKAGVRAAGG